MTAAAKITRWIVVGALAVATGAMFIISLRGNYLYGYGIGQSDEKRLLFAWANVAADIWKAFGLVAITMLWRSKHRRVALTGSVAWFVCLLTGINSAIGVYVQDRTALTSAQESRHANYQDAERELADIDVRRAPLASLRSTAELDALIATALAKPVIVNERVRGAVARLSANCTAPDVRTVEACADVARLRSERVGAEEDARLHERASALRVEIARLRERGSASPPDPVGEFYSWATRGLLSVRDVGFGFPLFFALMIEIVTAFGTITVVRFAEVSAPSTSTSNFTAWRAATGHVATRPVKGFLTDGVDERVAAWMSARATPSSDGGATSLSALHRDYERGAPPRVCQCQTQPPLPGRLTACATYPSWLGRSGSSGRGTLALPSEPGVRNRENILPTSLPPRGLSRVQAAAYIGVSPTLFDQMVEDRRMPKPVRINARVLWDRIELDDAFAALSHGDTDEWPEPTV